MMVLDQELQTFQRQLPQLLQEHKGEFVLIQGDKVDSFWKTENEGYEAGCQRFGVKPFLVKQVQETEHPLKLFVDVSPRCPS